MGVLEQLGHRELQRRVNCLCWEEMKTSDEQRSNDRFKAANQSLRAALSARVLSV